jgi:hypothetical protein
MAPNEPLPCVPKSGISRRTLLGSSAALAIVPMHWVGSSIAEETSGALTVLRHDVILRPLPRGSMGPVTIGTTGERAAFRVRDATGAMVDFRPAPG